MNIGSIENAFYSGAVNPILRRLIHNIDEFCPEDGSLVINSLKAFLGEKIELCNRCRKICEGLALPFYEVSSILLHMDRGFMRRQFIQDKYRGAWLKGFALTMKGVGKYGVQIPFTPAGPFEVVWNFTYKCNLRCKHCYENAGHRREELSTDDAKRVVDILSRIANIGIPAISFSGGEPLMREDFFEVASYTRGKIPYISLATNGTMISRDIAAKLKDVGVEYVEISIDGASAEKHDWFRGVPGAFDRAVEGAHNCIREGIDTCVASVIHRENFDEMEKIIELAGEIDARFMHFNYVPTGRAKVHLELDLTPKERLHVLETIGSKILDLYLKSKEEELKLGESSIKVDRYFSTCPQYASVVKDLSQRFGERFTVAAHYGAKKGVESVANFLGGCGAGRLYVAIEPNGDIKPCVFFPTNEETVIGNILRDDFEVIWDCNPLLWKIRSREELKTYVVDGREVGCGSCPDKYICGGCRARAYSYFNGDATAPDIGCIRNESLWCRIASAYKVKTYV